MRFTLTLFSSICSLLLRSPTKASMVASIIFVLDKKTDIISAPHALVYFGIVIFFVYFKVQLKILSICSNEAFVKLSTFVNSCLLFFWASTIPSYRLKTYSVLFSWEEFGTRWQNCSEEAKRRTRRQTRRKQTDPNASFRFFFFLYAQLLKREEIHNRNFFTESQRQNETD